MKTQFVTEAVALAATVLLAGCAGTPSAPDVGHQHPANAQAETSPLPPLQTGLLSLTNAAVQAATPKPEPEHQHGHKK